MNRNRKEKKGYLEFMIIILVSGLFGGVGALVIGDHGRDVEELGRFLESVIGRGAFYLIVLMSILGSIANIYMVMSVRKKCRDWDGEDDEIAEQIEKYNNRCQGIITCCATITMVLSGVNIVYAFHRAQSLPNIVVMSTLFVLYSLWCAFSEHLLVEQTKKMNPEKKGNALSLHFNRDWVGSCDEQEKARMYEAAYIVYKNSFVLYTGIFIFMLMLTVAVDIGVLPFLILGIIWTFQNVLYMCSYERKR